jgi:hypothetical protein
MREAAIIDETEIVNVIIIADGDAEPSVGHCPAAR